MKTIHPMTKEAQNSDEFGSARCPQRADDCQPTRPHSSSPSRSGLTRATFNFAIRHSTFVIAIALSTILHQLSTPAAHAQYSITWSTIDGGGGTSTGGVYSVSVTIGQPDAGAAMTNGQYSVTGGFWALPTAIQVTGAPTLTIAPATPGNATISWSPNTPGFVLQETWSLSPTNWTNSASGAMNPITVSATNAAKFYRLKNQ